MRLSSQRGDTIIEVMVAFAVFAMVAVGALNVMNQGTASAEDTLETTHVRQQIDNQAEMLRFLHQAYLANPNDTTVGSMPDKFRTLVNQAKQMELDGVQQATQYGQACTQTLPGNATHKFVLDPNSGARLPDANVRAADDPSAAAFSPYAQIASNGNSYGLWVEPIISEAAGSGEAQYIDFHVKACWNGASSSPQRTLGTIVRLYVPENVATGTTGGGTIAIPTPAANVFTMQGREAVQCNPHTDVEREDAEGDPGWNPSSSAFYMNPVQPQWACQRSGNEIFSCVNYDTWFEPAAFTAASNGRYSLTVSYDDAISCSGVAIAPPYNFKLAVYVDGVKRGPDYNLVAPAGGYTIPDIGTITETSVIQLRWWNNHFGPSSEDPDFLIRQVRIERIGV